MKLISTLLAASLLASAPAFASKEIATKNACMGCHAVDKKIVGPAYKDVAAKYKGQADAVDKLAKKVKAGGNNQKLKLFKRGKAISGAPIIKGTNQFPKPLIKVGMTVKKIIIKACAVITTLYS